MLPTFHSPTQRSVTDFPLESALDGAAAPLADPQVFELAPDQWRAFVAALDIPHQINARLTRLLQQPSVFEV